MYLTPQRDTSRRETPVLVLRFYFWVYVIHFATFLKQTPWAFFIGLPEGLWYFVRLLMTPSDEHQERINIGVQNVYEGWETNTYSRPPRWMMRSFLALARE